MIVVCNDNTFCENNLTIGKSYYVHNMYSLPLSTEPDNMYYQIQDDKNILYQYLSYRFKCISEIRKEKINKILCLEKMI